jgi:polyisoprenoid-binding protein YceI
MGWVIVSMILDPGDKNDTSTDLVTPTIAAQRARVFGVLPANSQVNFRATMLGGEINGVFPVTEGTITLEPVGDALRVLVRLNIHVDAVDTGNDNLDLILRGAMKTGDYPIAFYVASSRELVPVTEDEIMFSLDGDLQVRNQTAPHSMGVTAQQIGPQMWAVATSDLDLANHGVAIPSFVGGSVIQLTARLQMSEIESIVLSPD